MRELEGRGYLLKCGSDTPYAGWITARQLEFYAPIEAEPWIALRALSELVRVLPGGLALLWDLPLGVLGGLPHETRAAFWSVLGHLPGLTLHVRDEALTDYLDGAVHGWFHCSQPPAGTLGQAWRRGWVGWVPEGDASWSIPGFGRAKGAPETPEDAYSGCIWGEVILPFGALDDLDVDGLLLQMSDAQARMEKNLSLRMGAHAWPAVFPFHRRETGWRIAILGGREYQLANGSWEAAATRLQFLSGTLSERLRCPVLVGTCHDGGVASFLGHQAMREGLPWRYSLPIPPVSPTFTPGVGADPRDPAPLEARAAFPEAIVPALSHPPVALLRLPNLPQESAVTTFLGGLRHVPAILWIPMETPPPGPFSDERPWAPASAFAPLTDPASATQVALFDTME